MKIKTITLEQTFNTGNYTNKKLSIVADIKENENVNEAFIELREILRKSFTEIQIEEEINVIRERNLHNQMLEDRIKSETSNLKSDGDGNTTEEEFDDLPF